MTRIDSIRAQIDQEDAAIIAAVQRRNYWVRRAQEENPAFVQAYKRENEIYRRYRDAIGYAGMLVATAVLRAGRSSAAEEARHTA